jgi:hypothetical protein
METLIFAKTEQGHHEIASRGFRLAARMRTLLLLVDGKRSAAELLRKTAGLGTTPGTLLELLDAGLIRQIATLPASRSPLARAPGDGAPAASEPDAVEAARIEAIYAFYTETIKSMLRLRGYALQLEVERAGTIEDFRALRRPYLDAVAKLKGKDAAHGLGRRLDELLYPEDAIAHTIDLNLACERAR